MIASECPDPCAAICASAASASDATRTPAVRLKNSVSKSSSPAARTRAPEPPNNSSARASARNSTPPSACVSGLHRSASACRNDSATASCTTTTSSALQIDTRRVFALSTTSSAIAKSAAASTYVWQIPTPPATTGIAASSRTRSISALPPRGTIRSIRSFIASNSPTSARSVLRTNCAASRGNPASARPSRSASASAALLRRASRPPRSTAALPLFRQIAAMSIVTFGRLS